MCLNFENFGGYLYSSLTKKGRFGMNRISSKLGRKISVQGRQMWLLSDKP